MPQQKAKQPVPGEPFAWTLNGFIPATNLFACGKAYRSAARAVLAALEQDSNEGALVAYPLVFLYRHAIEAYVKGVLLDFGSPLGVPAAVVRKRRHDLCQQMVDLYRVSESGGKPITSRTLSAIQTFNAIDPAGTLFRYNEAQEYKGVFNLKHFSDEIELVLDELEELYSDLRSGLLQEIELKVIENSN